MGIFSQWFFYSWNFVSLPLFNIPIPIAEFLRKLHFLKKFRKVKPFEDNDFPEFMDGLVCVMTGGTQGIGLEVVKVLLKKGCHVIIASNDDDERRRLVYEQLMNETQNRGSLDMRFMDLSSMESVRKVAEEIRNSEEHIDLLICSAGVMFVPRIITEDGLELHWSINYVGHCLFTWILLPKIKKRPDNRKCRIILVSSGAHRSVGRIRYGDLQYEKLWSPHHAYGQSKAAMIMFGYQMKKYLSYHKANHITINSLHPGMIVTDLFKHMSWFTKTIMKLAPITRSKEDGAGEILYAALSAELEDVSGIYLEDCKKSTSSWLTESRLKQEELWTWTWNFLKKWIENLETN